jgi:hypothetical protein
VPSTAGPGRRRRRCDRKASYRTLTDTDAVFRDRFTDRVYTLALQLRRDFAELSAANELDIVRIDTAFREKWGPGLLTLFTRFRPLLSEQAWQECQAVLSGHV